MPADEVEVFKLGDDLVYTYKVRCPGEFVAIS
jgi:hypothetical protein